MKKTAAALAILFTMCTVQCTFAGYNEYQNVKDGFTGTHQAKYITAAQAKKMPDNAYVTLKGKITSKIGNEKYLFQDSTGTIEIEIDDKDWRGVQAGPNDTVIIEGEIDKEWNSVSIDVDFVRLAQ